MLRVVEQETVGPQHVAVGQREIVADVVAFVGEALGLKPISFVYDGAVKVCDKVRGEKALAAGICKKVAARVQQPEKRPF